MADFHLDGKADVFTAVTFGDSYGTMNLGAGDGNFQAATRVPLSTGVYVNAVADFNGDGKPDLLATNCSSLLCGIKVSLGNGDGTFQTTPVSATATLQNLVADDLNGDGKADVVGIFNGRLFVYVGNGDGTFTAGASYTFASNSGDLALGDFNADGKTDIVISTSGDIRSEGQVIVFLATATELFSLPKCLPGLCNRFYCSGRFQ